MKALVLCLISLPILLVGIALYFLATTENNSPFTDLIADQGVSSQNISLNTLSNKPNISSGNDSTPTVFLGRKVNDWNNTSPIDFVKKINGNSLEVYEPVTKYYESGKKEMKGYLKGDSLFSAEVWKPNGELCPVTNLSNGNGVVIRYNSWGTQWYRQTYRNGLPISVKQRLRTGELSSKNKETAEINKKRSPEDLLIKKKMVRLAELLFAKGLGIELIWCEPGSFFMGSPDSEEGRGRDETLHKVSITRGFFLGKKEISQEQWEKVMKKNPSFYKGKNLPVDSISHVDATLFCRTLNESEKKAKRLPKGMSYQLPTEAQWEYACRAGSQTIYSFGNHLTKNQGNIKKGEGGQIATGSTLPNRWGFQEMHGNVWEWCKDKYIPFGSEPVIDPICTDSASKYYVQRSGMWLGNTHLRSALRHHNLPTYKGKGNGMRVCLALPDVDIQLIDFENLKGFD